MDRHNYRYFSTKDRDNDGWPSGSKAVNYKSGWWYGQTNYAILNGVYRHNGARMSAPNDGVNWRTWLGGYFSLKATEMKIRRH